MTNVLENITLQTKGQLLIYLVSLDGKPCYVGQVYGKNQSVARRFEQHCKRADHGVKLYEEVKKQGPEKFSVSIIDQADDRAELDAKEQHWIRFYDTYVNGLNGNTGGNCSLFTTAGMPLSEERKAFIGSVNRGRKHTEEARIKIHESLLGNKRSAAPKGSCPEERREKISATLTGKEHSETRRKNQKAAALARFSDPAKKQAWLDARWGKQAKRTVSEETKAKTRAAMLEYHAKRKELG